MAITNEAQPKALRRLAIDHLTAEAARREAQFLVPSGMFGENALNPQAVAEWAWGLLERQKEAMVAALERELGGRP